MQLLQRAPFLLCLLFASRAEGTVNNAANDRAAHWNALLHEALKDADRVVITETLTHSQKTALVEETDRNQVRNLARSITVDEARSGDRWTGIGGQTLRFFAGDRLLVHLEWVTWDLLRWHGGKWTGDAVPTIKAQRAWAAWLEEHGHASTQAELTRKLDNSEEDWHDIASLTVMLAVFLSGMAFLLTILLRSPSPALRKLRGPRARHAPRNHKAEHPHNAESQAAPGNE